MIIQKRVGVNKDANPFFMSNSAELADSHSSFD